MRVKATLSKKFAKVWYENMYEITVDSRNYHEKQSNDIKIWNMKYFVPRNAQIDLQSHNTPEESIEQILWRFCILALFIP